MFPFLVRSNRKPIRSVEDNFGIPELPSYFTFDRADLFGRTKPRVQGDPGGLSPLADTNSIHLPRSGTVGLTLKRS